MFKSIVFFFSVVILFSFISCDSEIETVDEDALGYSYAPLEIGKYWVYKSDSLVVKQLGMVRDTLSGYIREEVTDTFIDASNQKAYRIERFFKRNLTDNWSVPRIWTASKSGTNFIKTEENLKFVKLVFPPVLNTTWEGNTFIDEQQEIAVGGEELQPYKGFWDYRIDSVDIDYVYENISLTDVIRVSHIDEEDFIEKRFSEERYAKGIGLVYRKMSILDTQCSSEMTPPCTGETFLDDAYKGYVLELQLIEHN